ncbi:hypothetical protein CI109_106784 [Kwoniella shandongensis]|uniref:Low temperature requirement A n=1 Tax=Kwoniella shandongensis TaxID=1734106 RepID=A0AAJ8LP30_9TREE
MTSGTTSGASPDLGEGAHLTSRYTDGGDIRQESDSLPVAEHSSRPPLINTMSDKSSTSEPSLANRPLGINTGKGDRTLKVEPTTATSQSNKPSLAQRIAYGAHNRELPRMPFLARPMEGDHNAWLSEEDEAAEWLSLFYDLAVVAVLTVFSSTHEIDRPYAIPIFFSYYVIISWVWTSQTHYDVRYQAEDGFHRLCKAVQILAYIYMGAATGNWAPANIRNDEAHLASLSAESASTNRAANDSFTTVLAAYAASRGFLAFQYIVCARNGRKYGRTISFQILSIGSLVISVILTIVAVALPAHSHGAVIAKLVLFYLAITVEALAIWSTVRRRVPKHTNTRSVGIRYGALTLIILGEGFMSVTRSFNYALAGLSYSNNTTYAQVFLVIVVMYLLFCFLLSRFRPEDDVHHRRLFFWEAIHFPMHFNLLLLIAAMVNTTVMLSYAHGSRLVANHYIDAINGLRNGTGISQADQDYLDHNLGRFQDEISELSSLAKEQDPTRDLTILAYQYFGQIMTRVTSSYGIELEYEQLEELAELYSINSTMSGDATLQQSRHEEVSTLIHSIIEEPALRTLSGILWLFPTAGGALILASIRSMIWYRYHGPAHWIVHGFQLSLGLILALLGLLDIGGRDVKIFADDREGELENVNPMYWLVQTKTPLLIVACVYGLAYLGSIFVLNQVERYKARKKKRSMAKPETEGHEEKEDAEREREAREVA